RDEVELAVGELQRVRLLALLDDVGAGEERLGGIELGLAGLGERDAVGVLAQEQRESAEATAHVGGLREPATLQQTTDRHLLGGVLVVAVVPVLRVVVTAVV